MGDTVSFLDTNVLVRHLTGEPEEPARRAGRLLREAATLFVPDLVMAELAYVLERRYLVGRAQVAAALRSVLAFPAVSVAEPAVLHRTIEIYEIHRLDFADAYLVAAAEASGVGSVASFDRAISRVGTVTRIEP